MILPLFCFGALMDRDVLSCVLGREPESRIVTRHAALVGYRKVCLPHETYPILVPEVDSVAEGVLLDGLTRQELDRIVFFEGEEFELSPCRTRLADGTGVEALFFDEGLMPLPESRDWSFAEWIEHHKNTMLRQSSCYMSYFGTMSAAEADYYWQTYKE